MTPSPYVVSIDPGLDETAIVRFDLRRWKVSSSFGDAGRALEPAYGLICTVPDMLLADRLMHLATEVERLCAPAGELAAGLVYLELPAKAGGDYGAMRTGRGTVRNARDMGKLHMAIGALIVGLRRAQAVVVPFPAPRFSKEKKHEAVRQILAHIGTPEWAKGPRGGENADVLDACFNGLFVLTEAGLRPAPWGGA